MKIIKTKFKDLVIIKKDTYFDKRGYLRELFKENILNKKFKFEILSYSKKNVLRGLHLQKKILKVNLLRSWKEKFLMLL